MQVKGYVCIIIDMTNYILGKVFHKDGTTSDRDYMSYSSHSMWKKDKNAYRKRYYEGEESFTNAEMIFGKIIAKKLENGEKIKGLKLFAKCEEPMNVKVEGIKCKGYADNFCPVKIKFKEFKTGHLDSKGNPPWNNVKVAKHVQLVWYYMMLKVKYGKCNPNCELVWLETEFKKNTIEYQGHVLEGVGRELKLTGKIEKFKRKIEEWEVEKLKKEILLTAEEIHNDFITWTKNK